MTEPVSEAWRTTVRARLDDIARDEKVTILLAIESGSRAWGFHSVDSDYDVRFIYCRPVDGHLRVFPGRDVIERPISDELDLSGWALRKTLGLILGSNAVALEWLQSPIFSAEAPGFRAALTGFMARLMAECALADHVHRTILDLIERNKFLTEADGIGQSPALTDALISAEVDHAVAELGASRALPDAIQTVEADAILAAWTRKCDPSLEGDRP